MPTVFGRSSIRVLVAGAALLLFGGLDLSAEPKAATPSTEVDFNRQILPILSDHCFTCHGPDQNQRKAKLRLDTKDGAFADLRGGGKAIVPGKLDDSELIRRISSTDAEEIMPPTGKGKPLIPAEIDLLKRWIKEGAPWTTHWAFTAPKRPDLPSVSDAKWSRTPIDRFILARLDHEGLRPSTEASKTTLLRRVTFDLTGLPPTLAELDAFLADDSPQAYEKAVNRLLESPRFGEHMARFWLDAARYGDTHGLHLDNYREMWPYRDWVVRAFNANMPFDRFITEQLAGDLLPNATLDQIVATGFVRCHVTTSEGGSIDEECYVRNVVDRADTFGEVMLGLTMGCCRCHDHKYDPITQRDYYSLFAFFNSIEGAALDGNAAAPAPVVKVGSPDQLAELERAKERIAAVRREIDAAVAAVKLDDEKDEEKPQKVERADYVWIEDDLPPNAKPSAEPWQWVTGPEHPILSGQRAMRRHADGLSQHYFTEAAPGLIVGADDALFAYVYFDSKDPPKEIMLQWNSGDWNHRAYWGENLIPFGADGTVKRKHIGQLPKAGEWVRLEVPIKDLKIKVGTEITGWAFTQFGGTVYWDKAGIATRTPQGEQSFTNFSSWLRRMQAVGGAGLPKAAVDAVKAGGKRTDAQKKLLQNHFIEYANAATRSTFEPSHKKLADAEKERDRIDKQMPTTLVCKEMPKPKPAFILKRGQYDDRGAQVERATPVFLPPMTADLSRDRLGMARWLVSPDNPLTARVTVNRFWQQCFGAGLVKTAEDFGTQGEPPSHPELLDWLAVEFRESGWDIKSLMRQIVLSAAYRQSSRVTPDRLAKDPANRLLARGPRFRLDAEMLRDQALYVSGLLIEKQGGPGVKPPQPAGLWEAVGYLTSNTRNFTADSGAEKVHRRSLYTFWKRTAPPPQMSTFDAPSREACMVRRERTNTPLQALLMMNEGQYVEAARALAGRALKEGDASAEDRLTWMFRVATCRKPDTVELGELSAAYRDLSVKYAADGEAAKKLATIGEMKLDSSQSPAEIAVYTMVANLILNLDEVLTKG
jgi:mono/diheme cytochrome c family protein